MSEYNFIRFVVCVDVRGENLKDAYKTLLNNMGKMLENSGGLIDGWESTDEVFDADGIEIDSDCLADVRAAVYRERMNKMALYSVRYVHKIAPSPADSIGQLIELPDGCFSDRKTLGKALRKAGVLPSGGRLWDYRVEGPRTVAFPTASVWHAIILERT